MKLFATILAAVAAFAGLASAQDPAEGKHVASPSCSALVSTSRNKARILSRLRLDVLCNWN